MSYIPSGVLSLTRLWSFRISWRNIVQLKLVDIRGYCSTHCNTAQIWSWYIEYSSSVVNRYLVIYVISCVGEKNGKIKIVSSFRAVKLCFVINVLNNKTIFLLNLAEYPPDFSQLGLRPLGLSIRRYSARFRRIIC